MAKYDPYDLLPEEIAREWRGGNSTGFKNYPLERNWGRIRIGIWSDTHGPQNIVYFDFDYSHLSYNIPVDLRQPDIDIVVQLLNKLSASRHTGYDMMSHLKLQQLWKV